MKRVIKNDDQGRPLVKPISVTVRWIDHYPACDKCRNVNTAKSATFALACAEGSPLLMEHLVNLQRPAQKEKEREVKEWAKRAGVFKIPR